FSAQNGGRSGRGVGPFQIITWRFKWGQFRLADRRAVAAREEARYLAARLLPGQALYPKRRSG
ncbi:MAG: hypothetical protein ACRDG9_12125, partial [Actinomycetota bacterium]